MNWTLLLLFILPGCFAISTSEVVVTSSDCSKAKNTCPDYSTSWVASCPDSARCITFHNACTEPVALAYQIGCNGDGTKGAPQCDCTTGPKLGPGAVAYFQVVNGDYTSCLPSWTPSCLTAGLAVLANANEASCTTGTRIEFSAGNSADSYDHLDSYDIDVEKGFSLPVSFAPALACANDHLNHDCRPLWCGSSTCPDAYATPTTGGCPDGRSPQAGCQDTFTGSNGFVMTYCPANCSPSTCPSCQEAVPCLVSE